MKLLRVFLVGFLAVFVIPVSVSAQNVQNFDIDSFTADYYLTRDENNEAELRVREKIVAIFPNFDQNRGILRAIPETYNGKSLRLEIESVQDEAGRNWQYSTSSQNQNTVLKIGNPNIYVRGEQTYLIEYSMRDVVTFYDGYDEFFWNVNGTQWPQPFNTVTARVHLPNDIASEITKPTKCFTGRYRSQAVNCEISSKKQKGETVITITAGPLTAYENVSFLMGFADETFQPYTPTFWEKWGIWLFISPAFILPLITLWWVVRRWRKYGKDPKGKGIIVTEYKPPKGFTAISSDGLLQERVRAAGMSAGIIELATQKYIVIHEAKSDKKRAKAEYSLELVKVPKALAKEQSKLLHSLFGSSLQKGSTVALKDKKNKLYKDFAELNKETLDSLTLDGFFRAHPQKVRQRWLIWGAVTIMVGFGLAFTGIFTPIGIGMIVSSLSIFVGAGAMPARTDKGVSAREHLLGLKRYMELAEKDRITFLQSPEGVRQYGDPTKPQTKVKLFETLLPYAMLFGIEKEWAKQFEDLYQQPPDWYQGNVTAFQMGYLASSIGDFSKAATTTFTAPSSSGSSGYSGGGGFSGGGGGGGGGGGW